MGFIIDPNKLTLAGALGDTQAPLPQNAAGGAKTCGELILQLKKVGENLCPQDKAEVAQAQEKVKVKIDEREKTVDLIEHLKTALAQGDNETAIAIIEILRSRKEDVPVFVSVYKKAVIDKNIELEACLIIILKKIGSPAVPEIVKALVEAAKDKEKGKDIAVDLSILINRLDADAALAANFLLVDELEKAIKNNENRVIFYIIITLEDTDKVKIHALIPALIEGLKKAAESKNIKFAFQLFNLFKKTGAPAVSYLVKALKEELKGENEELKFYITIALGSLGEQAVPGLIQELKDVLKDAYKDIKFAEDLIFYLSLSFGDIGEPALAPLIEELKKASESNNENLSIVMLKTLIRLGVKIGEPVITALDGLLSDPKYKNIHGLINEAKELIIKERERRRN